MTVDVLLTELTKRDVVLSVNGDRLLFDAPIGALTPELRAAITAHRAELIRQLSATAAANVPAAKATQPPTDFSRWVFRQAADETPGWEAPDLSPSSRWWGAAMMNTTRRGSP